MEKMSTCVTKKTNLKRPYMLYDFQLYNILEKAKLYNYPHGRFVDLLNYIDEIKKDEM